MKRRYFMFGLGILPGTAAAKPKSKYDSITDAANEFADAFNKWVRYRDKLSPSSLDYTARLYLAFESLSMEKLFGDFKNSLR